MPEINKGSELNFDRVVGSAKADDLGQLRLNALAQADTMLRASQLPQPLIVGNDWIPLGPTAIRNGETLDRTNRRGTSGIFVTGRVTAIAIHRADPKAIYIGTALGGVWKTVDDGANWTPTSDFEASLAIGALAIDPLDPQTLYAGTGEGNLYYESDRYPDLPWQSYYGVGMLKSTNGGNSWSLLGQAEFSGGCFFRIAINPLSPNIIYASNSKGFFRSLDGGLHWDLMTVGLPGAGIPSTDVVIDPTTPGTVYAAFWGEGVFKSTNADAAAPTWTAINNGLPHDNRGRIAIALSPSNPQTVYAGMAAQLAVSGNGGANWTSAPSPGAAVGLYCCAIRVDPQNSSTIYVCSMPSLWKVDFTNPAQPVRTILSQAIHADQHDLVFDPNDPGKLYLGNDGGIFRSSDGGITWTDSLNHNLSITQFTFMDQHPSSDAWLIGGTQDNGTNQYRNSTVFYHSDDGDGGAVATDTQRPANILHHCEEWLVKRSTDGGDLDTWSNVVPGRSGAALFYPPLTLDLSNPQNAAFGAQSLFLDDAQGTNGWAPASAVNLGLNGDETISAIHYLDSNTIFVGTTLGKVFRLRSSAGSGWNVQALHALPLPPTRFIWDICALPNDPSTIVVVFSGFGGGHVFRGVVGSAGPAAWTDISGNPGAGRLPDIPVNALAVETANTMFIGADIGVFCTTDGGANWAWFSEGLPLLPANDMRLRESTNESPRRLLRVATHGRGMWERDLDAATATPVNIFLRANVMSSGRTPLADVIASFSDPLQGVKLGDTLHWWQCADIKVDAPGFQMPPGEVDYIAFESALEHRAPKSGQGNRVHLQVHNRGSNPAKNVQAKLLYSYTTSGLRPLPSDFWTKFPADSTDTSAWVPVGAPAKIASVSPTKPEVVSFDWAAPSGPLDRICFLAVIDCADDPIPAGNKITAVDQLVKNERRAGLRAFSPPP